MYVYVKYLILVAGFYGAIVGIVNRKMTPAIVSVGAFIAFAVIESRDLKTLNEDKE